MPKKQIKEKIKDLINKVPREDASVADTADQILELFEAEKQKLTEEIKKIGLTKEQSTKIFTKIEKDEKKLMEDLAYSAPEIIKQRIKEFYWDLYLRGRIDEKEDILEAFT